MLEKLNVELELIARHLAISDYFKLYFALHSCLPKIPEQSFHSYKESVTLLNNSQKFKHSGKEYPIRLSSDYYHLEAFDFAIEVSDLNTFRKVLVSGSLAQKELETTIQRFVDEEIDKPRIGWEIVNRLHNHHHALLNDFYSSILYFQSVTHGMVDIFLELMNHPHCDIVHSQNDVFLEACKYGREQIVRILRNHPQVNINYRDESRELSGFAYAAYDGHLETVKYLLEQPITLAPGDLTYITCSSQKGTVVNKLVGILINDNRANWSEFENGPITSLCTKGHTKALKKVLNLGQIDPNSDFVHAANCAVQHRNYGCLDLLFSKTNVNPYPDIVNFTLDSDDLEGFKYLMEDPRALVTKNTIFWMVNSKAPNILEYVMENHLADLSNSEIRNSLALHFVKNNQKNYLERLLKIGKIEITPKLEAIFFNSMRTGNAEGLLTLLQEVKIVTGPVWERCSLKAAKKDQWKVVEKLLDSAEFTPSYRKNELLRLACEKNRFPVVKKIIQHPKFKYGDEDLPFMALMRNNNAKIMRFMMANLPFDPAQKRNLLFRNACKYSKKYFIRYLLTVDRIDPTDLNHQAAINILKRNDDELNELLKLKQFKLDQKSLEYCTNIALNKP
ncbi:hypothetical protein HK103_006539 [Boothiomyces macroporosus]|uniref:Ankyrin repeat protein n=1 Tax=Boothiomyces macroporosus TaxID=261099 RepID=A0AAD5Y210_9FUNG|nr:hypothetical protein HK103_006539 [Boothiomyces macroporosus]